jgi:hypothetical protein
VLSISARPSTTLRASTTSAGVPGSISLSLPDNSGKWSRSTAMNASSSTPG